MEEHPRVERALLVPPRRQLRDHVHARPEGGMEGVRQRAGERERRREGEKLKERRREGEQESKRAWELESRGWPHTREQLAERAAPHHVDVVEEHGVPILGKCL